MTHSNKPTNDDVIQDAGHDFELLGKPANFTMFTLGPAQLQGDKPETEESTPTAEEPAKPELPPEEKPSRPVPVRSGSNTVSAASLSPEGSSLSGETVELPQMLPLLPVDRLVVFPHMIAPLTITRDDEKQLVDDALKAERMIGVFTRKEESADSHADTFETIHSLGSVCVVLRMLRVPDGSMRLLVHGVARAQIAQPVAEQPYLKARLTTLPDIAAENDVEIEAIRKSALTSLQKIIQISSLSEELGVAANNIDDTGKLADLIASNIQLKTEELLEILGEPNIKTRLKRVLFYLSREMQVLELGSRIQSQVKTEIDRNQREYVLREQMKAIRQELGEEEPYVKEMRELRERLAQKAMPDYARRVASKELDRLEQMQPASAEYGVIRTYLEWFFDLPWEESTRDNIDINRAEAILNDDHYGLEKVKERILEFLAVIRLRESMKGPILCFVGPPGVGKTSLGRSIARAMERKFTRFSLGGMRDEAEIRGHRRTYIGAMPGRIIKALKECASNNPLIMLDEIDKLGTDFRGDPASALLEVLDPEQNYSFSDHYMDVPFDLSKVMFITTANQLDTIPGPLRDRMEIIEISGYTTREKLAISRQYLIPRELTANGVRASELKFTPNAISTIIQDYTREAGVRNVQRQIATACRKTARKIAQALGPEAGAKTGKGAKKLKKTDTSAAKTEEKTGTKTQTPSDTGKAAAYSPSESFGRPKPSKGPPRIKPITISPGNLREFLGPPKAFSEMAHRMGRPGIAIGMAWTPAGGDILFIEATRHPGTGKMILTGMLGDVMKESAQAALTYLHSQTEKFGIPEELFAKTDIHIHVPAGAVPKDGPSAGTAITAAVASLLSGRPVRDYLAMTGEITLRGAILPVGGIKEKCLAAHRAGIKTIVLPQLNRDDYDELPREIKKQVKFHFIDRIDEIIPLSLRKAAQKPPASPGNKTSSR
jgi:ATP-dependent Lon protease